ncbi:glycosyltransferase [Mesonia ostreae]|uniref:Glycosyltransferase n=1 Tax=Mesonia ostreae TaxID=861110 RepID=A0ABU2KH72_9FLAO|nr:glycosyltransferase [Mesonia ostreae]MDT0294062.1 glycosyltransferase [Mesonia ostreae]
MDSKNKILIVAPCLAMGGMERASVNTAQAFNEKGVEVIFISLFKKTHFFKLDNGIQLEEPVGFNSNKLSLLKSIRWIKRLLSDHKPCRVLVFSKFYGAITALAMIGNKTPLYISERSSPLFVWRQPMNLINSTAFKLRPPKGIIAQTSIAAQYQKKYFKKSQVQVIPNILREVSIYPEIERKKVILAVGRLGDYLKGFDLLIESFALLKDKNWELHIAGGDENGQEVKTLASKLGVIHRIKFLGKVKDIDKIYAYASIFVIPSRSEGFPNALAEAMAAGCLCIAFDFIAGPRDMINSGENGIIVEDRNVKALAEAIDLLILQPEKRQILSNNAKEIRKHLNRNIIADKILSFLNMDL